MIKRLAGCIRQYKLQTILTPVFMVGEVTCECIIPLITSRLVNGIQNGCGREQIIQYGIQLFLMAMLSLSFGVASGWFCATAASGFAKNLRHDLYYKVQDFSFANIDRFSTSSLVTRLTTDVSNIQNAFMMLIRMAVRAPMMLIIATVMSVRVGKQLAFAFAAIIPFLGFGLGLMVKKALPLFRAVFKKYDRLNNSVQENIQAMRVVKSFVREGYETEKFTAASDDVRKDFLHAERLLALNSPLMNFCIAACRILISYFAARLIIGSHGSYLGVGSLTSMITYSMQILMSLNMLSMVFVMITMSSASVKRVCEVLDEQSDLHNPAEPVYTVPNGSVDFDNGGIDVRAYDLTALRDQVAVVLQKNVLFSGTIKDNLRWGDPNATDEEMLHACRVSHADEFIQTFPDRYDTYIEQGGTNVSGGQKQRLCIARALLKKPKVLIFDDSTSAVDTRTDALIRQALREEIPGTTKFIIAQRISSVQDADLIVVMDDGRIESVGTHEALLQKSEIYREVYESQNRIGGVQNG